MDEILTIEEIRERFDAEWVLIEDPKLDDNLNVISGKVVWHSKNRDEVHQKALELRPKHPAFLYTGKLPAGTAIIL